MKVREVTNMVLDEVAPYYDEIIAQCFCEIDGMDNLTFAEKKAVKNRLVSNLVKGAVGVGGAAGLYLGRGAIGRGLAHSGRLVKGASESGSLRSKIGRGIASVGRKLYKSQVGGAKGDIGRAGEAIKSGYDKIAKTAGEWGGYIKRKVTGKKK